MIGISKTAGVESFNSETVAAALNTRTLDFEALGQRFRCEVQVPVYIWDKLTLEDWDYVERAVTKYAEQLRRQAALSGSIFVASRRRAISEDVSAHARQAVYNQFMKYQATSGNHEGHEVPMVLQP